MNPELKVELTLMVKSFQPPGEQKLVARKSSAYPPKLLGSPGHQDSNPQAVPSLQPQSPSSESWNFSSSILTTMNTNIYNSRRKS